MKTIGAIAINEGRKEGTKRTKEIYIKKEFRSIGIAWDELGWNGLLYVGIGIEVGNNKVL